MKRWWWSKTLLINGVSTGVAVLGAIAGQEWIMSHPQAAAGIATAIGVLNIINRFLTTTSIR